MRQKALLCPSLPIMIGPASLASHIRAARSAVQIAASSKLNGHSKGAYVSPRGSNVSPDSARFIEGALSIGRLHADHPVPSPFKSTFFRRKPLFGPLV